MSEIKLTMLGTSAVVPTAKRNHVATLLTYKGENILVDCGEGTQRQFKKARISPTKITRILITHWHGDHVLGLPGLIQTMALMEYSKTLHIYGPKKSKEKFKKIMSTFVYAGEKFPIKIHEISKKQKFCDEKDFYLQSAPMTHKSEVSCNAY
ncbi:MBL fold metallo-hydrolase, partial [Candidatus Pacearchaeota archaeon]|nr:MBL fold metallo-hydrolase [Candidatus Pacearchaeota archaeon]